MAIDHWNQLQNQEEEVTMWLTIRAYLVSFVLPIAIDILSNIAENIGPKVKAAITDFFQDQYDDAVLSGDTVWQSIIVGIIAPIFGLTITLSTEGPGILSPAEIVSMHKTITLAAAKKTQQKFDADKTTEFQNPPPMTDMESP